jgi:hypothetical protein
MKRQRLGISAIAIFAAVSSGLAIAPLTSVAVAAAKFCAVGSSYGGTTITWTGKGNGHSWSDAANWSPSTVPDGHQTPATYQTQYVCIGDNKGGGSAKVSIAGTQAFHVAGVDVGQGAELTIKPGGRLFLGANTGTATSASSVDKHSTLVLDASTLGGNSPLTVAGTLKWTGDIVKAHKTVTTQTSSECVFDPSISACPGDTTPGGGKTTIAVGGKMLVNGVKFGGADLTDGRVIDNFGTVTFTDFGYVAMNNGTSWTDEPHSTVKFDGLGGIYRGASGAGGAPKLHQHGALVRNGTGSNVVVVGVPVTFGKGKSHVKITRGSLVLNRTATPKAPVGRGSGYGVGSCKLVKVALCKQPAATAGVPQVAFLGTSKEAGSPKISQISVSLINAPAKLHGHAVLGQAVQVVAPHEKTTHSSHLTFSYDATTAGLTSSIKAKVYRGSHAITLCAVHGLTALNTSCIVSEKVAHGGAATKGDLTIIVITIQPKARWIVTR